MNKKKKITALQTFFSQSVWKSDFDEKHVK